MNTKTKKPVGAPSKKTPELIAYFLDGIAQGKSSRTMCKELDISQDSLWRWLANDDEFSEQYARAKIVGADFLAEEVIEISDDSRYDRREDDNGRLSVDSEVVNRSRLRVDARKWYLSKIAPKKYGDKVIAEHQGNPEQPIAHSINIRFIKSDTSAA